MNMQYRIIFGLAVIFLTGAVVFGQERSLEKAEFEAVVKQATDKSLSKTRRETETIEMFAGGSSSPTSTRKSVSEVVPPDRYYIRDVDNNSERIRIGTKWFSRKNNEAWKQESGLGYGRGNGCGANVEYAVYKVFENTKLGAQTVSLYEMTSKLNDMSCTTEKSRIEIWVERYWIARDGTLLKEEKLTQDGEKRLLKRFETVYEYDPKIRIEAPIK